MHAVMAGMLGISELHRRNASLVHICCASALKAKLALDDSAEKETAKAATNPARRSVLERNAVIVGSHWPGSAGPVSDALTLPQRHRRDCDVGHTAEFGSAATAFRGRGSVWMTYGDGRHPVSSIDDVGTSRLAARNDDNACGQNYFA
jgi:hypothetical protein